jgi:hypothetical protein
MAVFLDKEENRLATLSVKTGAGNQRIYQDKKVQAHAKIVDVGERHLRM